MQWGTIETGGVGCLERRVVESETGCLRQALFCRCCSNLRKSWQKIIEDLHSFKLGTHATHLKKNLNLVYVEST